VSADRVHLAACVVSLVGLAACVVATMPAIIVAGGIVATVGLAAMAVTARAAGAE